MKLGIKENIGTIISKYDKETAKLYSKLLKLEKLSLANRNEDVMVNEIIIKVKESINDNKQDKDA